MMIEFAYTIGAPVLIQDININGRIDALMRDSTGNSYRVIYWNDGTRRSEWMYEWELGARQKAGQ